MKTMGVILMCKQKITKVVGVAGQQSKSCFQTERLSQINGGDIDVSLVSKLKKYDHTKSVISSVITNIYLFLNIVKQIYSTPRAGVK